MEIIISSGPNAECWPVQRLLFIVVSFSHIFSLFYHIIYKKKTLNITVKDDWIVALVVRCADYCFCLLWIHSFPDCLYKSAFFLITLKCVF